METPRRLALPLVVPVLLAFVAGFVGAQNVVRSFDTEYQFSHKYGSANPALIFWTPRSTDSGNIWIDYALAMENTQGWIALGRNLDNKEAMIGSVAVMARNLGTSGWEIWQRDINGQDSFSVPKSSTQQLANASAGIDGKWQWMKFSFPAVPADLSGLQAHVVASRYTDNTIEFHNFMRGAFSINLQTGASRVPVTMCDPASCIHGTCDVLKCSCDSGWFGTTCSQATQPSTASAPVPVKAGETAPDSASSTQNSFFYRLALTILLGHLCIPRM